MAGLYGMVMCGYAKCKGFINYVGMYYVVSHRKFFTLNSIPATTRHDEEMDALKLKA